MQQEFNYTIETTAPEAVPQPLVNSSEDYSALLKGYSLQYKRVDHYLQVGVIDWTQGWIIDISVIQIQFQDLVETVVPVLVRENIPFKIPRNAKMARSISAGEQGYVLLGKVVSIYPPDDIKALDLARRLIDLTHAFKGPEILTDRHLGNVVYTRYGACNALILTSDAGIEENWIYDPQGKLIKDPIHIPFVLPKGVLWPFTIIVPAKTPKRETVLQDRYKPISTLKKDAKGNVKKGLWLEKWWRIKWCLIKEGKRYMLSDADGRDATDRLRWQYELQKDLQESLPIPRIYDHFEENGDSYLVMQYIGGVPFGNIIGTVFNNKIWNQLLLEDRLMLLDYTIKMLEIINRMHEKGYIHRDITPNNFLITKKKEMWMIDLELSYCEHLQKPSPPFRLGTPGFMSPEQEEASTPTIAQDIYAIGAVLIGLLTGIPPNEFAIGYPVLKQQLSFFIPDEDLVNIVCNCCDGNADLRPSVPSVRKSIEQFREKQNVTADPLSTTTITPAPGKEKLKEMIVHALEGLARPAMVNRDKIWVSKTAQQEELAYSQSESVSVYEGLYQGVSGVLYLLARAYAAGIPIDRCKEGYMNCLAFVRKNDAQQLSEKPAGFYFGTSGVAVALSEGIKSKLISPSTEIIEEIKSNLEQKNTNGLGMVKGIAGQGIALLKAASMLEDAYTQRLLQKKIDLLLEQQQEDGSWMTLTDTSKTLIKVTGFGHGVAGISCFLFEYIKQYGGSIAIRESAAKAANWLTRQTQKKKGFVMWPLNNKNKQYSRDFQDGVTGIVLSLIKAYEISGDPEYRQLAEDCLRNYSRHSVSRDITLATGLVGLGEVLLEASIVFKSEEWQERADWIAQFLLHHFQREKGGSCYWSADGSAFSTADLAVGNSGIIHFLLRCYQPGRFSHPMLAF